MTIYLFLLSAIAIATLLFAFIHKSVPVVEYKTVVQKPFIPVDWVTPDWVKSSNIYEVNIQQYSPAGDFKGFAAHLPRLKDLGVDILWLMPIYPVCETNRKSHEGATSKCIGSGYAAYDFKAVNPDFGTLEEFKVLVNEIHSLDMKVVLDFVPDHTGWDSLWMKEHPEYFVKVEGEFTVPIDPANGVKTDWDDVAMLDYSNPELRAAVIDAHEYWMNECGIDGYREDVAGFVPTDFWAELRVALNKIRPVFMLAEWEAIPEQLAVCFEANYGWHFHSEMKAIAKGEKSADSIDAYLAMDKAKNPAKGWHMHFTQNHDENTWNGTIKESFGAADDLFTVFAHTFDGMGLVYSGQEASLDKRLLFFNKDEIDWTGASKADFFKKLLGLKHRNQAIWNGLAGGQLQKIVTNEDSKVYAFMREKNGDKVVGVFNMSAEPLTVTLEGNIYVGDYQNVFDGTATELKADTTLVLKGWEYLVLSNR